MTPPASKSKFELVPDFLQARISKDNDDEIFKFGGLKQQWEKDAIALAWKLSDIPMWQVVLCIIMVSSKYNYCEIYVHSALPIERSFIRSVIKEFEVRKQYLVLQARYSSPLHEEESGHYGQSLWRPHQFTWHYSDHCSSIFGRGSRVSNQYD